MTNIIKIIEKEDEKGFSLVEVILAFTIFVLIVTTLIGAYIFGQQSTAIAGLRSRAVFLADEAIEAVLSIKNDAWNEVFYDSTAINVISDIWEFQGEGTTETIGIFTREIVFEDVCRNNSGVIAACPADYTDIHSKKIVVTVSWEYRVGFTQSVVRETYISNWRSMEWVQTDWSGGDGQSIWSDESRYLSDEGNVDISTSGRLTLGTTGLGCAGYIWTFDNPGNYNYDSSKVEIISSTAQLKGTAGGDINDTIVDTLEFDTNKGKEPSILNISGDVFAIAYQGDGDDGFLKTIEMSSSGVIIDAEIDILEFDTLKGKTPSILNVSGDIYAIAYEGDKDDGFLKTVEIVSSGMITDTEIDVLEFDTDKGKAPNIVNISGNIYAIAYQGDGDDGFLKTIEIASNGMITDTEIDVLEFDVNKGKVPTILNVSGDIYAIAYQGDGDDGFLKTVEIATNGMITDTEIDVLEFDTGKGVMPEILSVSGDIYAIVYQGDNDDGFLKTVEIASNGMITDTVIDTLEFDVSKGKVPNILSVSGDIYAIAYQGDGDDGFLKTIEIASNGMITDTEIDVLEFNTSKGMVPNIIRVSGNIYAIVYHGDGDDGFLVTIEILSGSYPTDNPSIYPTLSYNPAAVDQWSGFSETANKDGGEIYYQISDDDGTTWYFWNGSSWVTAGAGEYNIAGDVNTNMTSFSASNKKMMFKAFLESDDSQLVQLDEVSINCSISGQFEVEGTLTSSAFDTGSESAIQVIEWNEDLSSCAPDCEIKTQIRAATDSGGSPDVWTDWYGETGIGTYFTASSGSLLPLDLNGNQWIQYRVLFSGDGDNTPILEDITINYK